MSYGILRLPLEDFGYMYEFLMLSWFFRVFRIYFHQNKPWQSKSFFAPTTLWALCLLKASIYFLRLYFAIITALGSGPRGLPNNDLYLERERREISRRFSPLRLTNRCLRGAVLFCQFWNFGIWRIAKWKSKQKEISVISGFLQRFLENSKISTSRNWKWPFDR